MLPFMVNKDVYNKLAALIPLGQTNAYNNLIYSGSEVKLQKSHTHREKS